MRRNRFEKILLFLHVADSNNLPKDKKVGRVSEYLDELQKNFKTHCIWDREFDINERMVEYFGRYGTFLKQSIRMKPIRFGYKIWCANLPLGYLFDFTIYEGSTGRKTDNITNFGLGAGVVFDIIDGLPVDSDGNLKPMLFSVENVFNSFSIDWSVFSQKHSYYKYFKSRIVWKKFPFQARKMFWRKTEGIFKLHIHPIRARERLL